MGNLQNCSKKEPYVVDACYVPIQGSGFVEDFCTLSGPAGDRFRHKVCSRIGPEFGGGTQAGGCTYNWCDSMSKMHGGCCKHPAHCCGIAGRGANCQRKAFYGEPVACCLLNSSCLAKFTKNKQCQDKKGFTCSDGRNKMPNHRVLTGKDCRVVLRDHFLGKDASLDVILDRWMDMSSTGAKYFIERVIRAGANCPSALEPSDFPFSAEGIVYASSLLRDFIAKFNSSAKPLHVPSNRWSSTYHEVQEVIYDIAKKYPVVMDGVLFDICADYTTQDLSTSKDLTRWCGCHLNPEANERYMNAMGVQQKHISTLYTLQE